MTLADTLKNLRKQQNMTQDEVAKLAGITRGTYVYYEKGIRAPKSRRTLLALATALKCDVSALQDQSPFVLAAGEQFGSRGKKQAEKEEVNMKALFAGGDLKDEDKEKLETALQTAFFEAKRIAKQKYSKKSTFTENSDILQNPNPTN